MANEQRLIDAKPLMEDGWHLVKTGKSNAFLASMSLADVPTVDAVEVVHGRWEYGKWEQGHWGKGNERCRCSVCHRDFAVDNANIWNGCPHCLAKMDGGNEDG